MLTNANGLAGKMPYQARFRPSRVSGE